jgi:hypothetical protein
VENPESDETLSPLASPFSFNLQNVIWLAGAAAVTLALIALKVMGAIR